MAHYSDLWWYADGSIAADQRAAVFEDDANTYASIFSDSGLITPLANPTTTDGSGLLDFYAANGDYWIFVGEEATGDSVLVTLGPAVTGAVLSVNGQTGIVTLDSVDVGAQPIATIDAKGDLYAGTGNDATTRLPVGADGEVLTADSGDPTGMSWQAGGGGGAVDSVNGQTGVVVLTAASVGADAAGAAAAAQAAAQAASQPIATINAKGDLYVGTANDTTTRKGVGADGTVLTASAADPTGVVWSAPASAPVTSVNAQIGAVVLGVADVGADPAGSAAAAQAASQPLDSDLTAIAGLTPTNDDIIQRKAGAWTNRTVAQYKTDLNYTAAGLGALAIANNLSDVASASTSRTNLGLGTAAVANTGVGATNVILGNDARLTDARTPTAHASTHASAGSDPVTLAQSQITNLTTDLAGKQPLDSDLTTIAGLTPTNDDVMQYKSGAWANRTIAQVKTDLGYTPANLGALAVANNLSDVANAGTSRTNLGLGGAAVLGVGTTAGTVAAGDDSRITGAVPKSTVTTKGDLIVATASATVTRRAVGSNGQVLTADSAETDGVKWATAGTDAGAQQRSTLTTKGDLYVATASATTARQAVGTDGYGMVADSTVTNGLKWAVPHSAAVYPRSTGYMPTGGVVTTRSSKTATQDTMYLIPFYLAIGATLSSIAFEVSGAVALAVVRLGLYSSDATTMLPAGAAFADYGTTLAATTGTKTAAVSTALTPGLWWLAFVGQTVAPTVRQCAGFSPFVASATFPTGSSVGWDNCYVQTGVTGALPSIGSLADSDGPMCGIKF